MENKRAHLEMIQGVINRLSRNSFHLKGWSVVLVSALFALAAEGSNASFVLIAYFPAVIFWGLDGYFLHQERLFRALYDHVRILAEEEIDFSMNTALVKESVATWSEVTLSKTLVPFHGVVIASVVFVMFATIFTK